MGCYHSSNVVCQSWSPKYMYNTNIQTRMHPEKVPWKVTELMFLLIALFIPLALEKTENVKFLPFYLCVLSVGAPVLFVTNAGHFSFMCLWSYQSLNCRPSAARTVFVTNVSWFCSNDSMMTVLYCLFVRTNQTSELSYLENTAGITSFLLCQGHDSSPEQQLLDVTVQFSCVIMMWNSSNPLQANWKPDLTLTQMLSPMATKICFTFFYL